MSRFMYLTIFFIFQRC